MPGPGNKSEARGYPEKGGAPGAASTEEWAARSARTECTGVSGQHEWAVSLLLPRPARNSFCPQPALDVAYQISLSPTRRVPSDPNWVMFKRFWPEFRSTRKRPYNENVLDPSKGFELRKCL